MTYGLYSPMKTPIDFQFTGLVKLNRKSFQQADFYHRRVCTWYFETGDALVYRDALTSRFVSSVISHVGIGQTQNNPNLSISGPLFLNDNVKVTIWW